MPDSKCKGLVLGIVLAANTMMLAQGRQETLQVNGYSGEAAIVQINGRSYVDLQALARITGSSVVSQGHRVVLTLPSTQALGEDSINQPASSGFSRPFMAAGIEALASMREWGSTLVVAIRNGFPLGNTINPYRARAAEKVQLAASAASTVDDGKGLELLRREFNNVQDRSNKLVTARNSMSAANLIMSEGALQQDPTFQSIVSCGQHLGQMFGSGSFQDTAACR